MQIQVNRFAVEAFNRAAPALESININGIWYEVFHDFYHLRPLSIRCGITVSKGEPSVAFRYAGQPDSFNFSSRAFFKRSCKAQKQLAAWMDAMNAKYRTYRAAAGMKEVE